MSYRSLVHYGGRGVTEADYQGSLLNVHVNPQEKLNLL